MNKVEKTDEYLRVKKLSEQGDHNAQNELAMMYEKGREVEKNYSEAWKWYSIAIKNQNKNAVDNRARLAKLLTRAEGKKVDDHMKAWIQETFEKNKAEVKNRIEEIVREHIKILNDKYNKTVYKDDYGKLFFDKWDNEMDYFIENIIISDRKIKNMLWDPESQVNYGQCKLIIDKIIENYQSESS